MNYFSLRRIGEASARLDRTFSTHRMLISLKREFIKENSEVVALPCTYDTSDYESLLTGKSVIKKHYSNVKPFFDATLITESIERLKAATVVMECNIFTYMRPWVEFHEASTREILVNANYGTWLNKTQIHVMQLSAYDEIANKIAFCRLPYSEIKSKFSAMRDDCWEKVGQSLEQYSIKNKQFINHRCTHRTSGDGRIIKLLTKDVALVQLRNEQSLIDVKDLKIKFL